MNTTETCTRCTTRIDAEGCCCANGPTRELTPAQLDAAFTAALLHVTFTAHRGGCPATRQEDVVWDANEARYALIGDMPVCGASPVYYRRGPAVCPQRYFLD